MKWPVFRGNFWLLILCISSNASAKKYCDKPQCVVVTSRMHIAIDESLNPCDDFYSFVCGSFLENTVLNDRRGKQFYDYELRDKDKVQVIRLIESTDGKHENKAFDLMRTFYRSCMNQDNIEALGNKPLLEAFESFGGWPLVDREWKTNGMTWIDLDTKFFRAGNTGNFLIEVFVGGDQRDHNKYTIAIQSPDHGVLGSFYDYLLEGLENDKIKAYYDYMVDLTTLMGAERQSAEEEMLKVLNFEIEYCKLANVESPDISFITLSEMNTRFSYLNWTTFLEIRLDGAVPLSSDTEIFIGELNFFAGLGDLLERTAVKTLANYLAWRLMEASKYLISSRYYQPTLDFSIKTEGNKRVEEGWKRCLFSTKQFFNVAVGALNARDTRVVVDNNMATIIANSKTEVFNFAKDNLEVSPKLSHNISQKLKDTKIYYKQPEEYFNDSVLEDYYKDLVMIDGQYFKNVLRMQRFVANKVSARLKKQTADSIWESYNEEYFDQTYYENGLKYIFLGSSEFRSPVYDRQLPTYLNYAGLGYTVVKYMIYALLNEIRHMKVQSLKLKSKCVNEQYESYVKSVFNLTIDGADTVSQNTADLLGFDLSYKTYKTWQKLISQTPKALPGLIYSPDQLFWIASAQQFCSIDRNIDVKRRKILSKLPLESFRVLNSLRNNKDFARDFKCPPGSPMNLMTKC